MSFLPSSRTKRRLLKVASLGLAGLIAGLFSGCTDSPDSSATNVTTPYTRVATDSLSPEASTEAQPAPLPQSLDATQIPALHHQPSARHLQYGAVHTVSMAMVPSGRSGY
jgi:hypothetical protein